MLLTFRSQPVREVFHGRLDGRYAQLQTVCCTKVRLAGYALGSWYLLTCAGIGRAQRGSLDSRVRRTALCGHVG
jgi:hypothetical protein